ncbi:nostrin-like [Oscarella lobularis]|uniref:nostrin-like n=1 Tax=Oscarella lobularis TaxID=121494 RepID=UPI00331431A7
MSHQFQDRFWEGNGFDELRKYLKLGEEFCKDVAGIFAERAEIEADYAKSVARLATKASKVNRSQLGTLKTAWDTFINRMNVEGETHKQFGVDLTAETSKPLKQFFDQQTKARKPIETMVEKASKFLADRRSDELKSKRNNYSKAKDCEVAHEQWEEAKSGRGKPVSEKDVQRMEAKVKKAIESAAKQDTDYREACRKAEEARQGWETAMYNCCQKFQGMDEEREKYLQSIFIKYTDLLGTLPPSYQESCNLVKEQAEKIDPPSDVSEATDKFGTGENCPDQIFYTCFEEDVTSSMNEGRRKKALTAKLTTFQQLVQQARKVKDGVTNLSTVYKDTPSYATDEAQNDVFRQLASADAMIDYYDAVRYNLTCALTSMMKQQKPSHRLADYIKSTRDKQNMIHASLRVAVQRGGMRDIPSSDDDGQVVASIISSASEQGQPQQQVPAAPKAAAPPQQWQPQQSYTAEANTATQDGGYEIDEFDDDDDAAGGDEFDNPEQAAAAVSQPAPQETVEATSILCQCEAAYDYQAQEADELTIAPGDVINVYEKQEDGWWQGELNGTVGIFPASYVTEI